MTRSNAQRSPAAGEAQWRPYIERLGLTQATLIKANRTASRRVYLWEGKVYKVWLHDGSAPPEAPDDGLQREYRIRKRCEGIHAVSPPVRYTREGGCELVAYRYDPGTQLTSLPLGVASSIAVFLRLSGTLLRLSWRGVAHNDLHPGNVVVDPRGRCILIDFEHATLEPRWRAAHHNFLRLRRVFHQFNGSMIHFVAKQCLAIVRRWRGGQDL